METRTFVSLKLFIMNSAQYWIKELNLQEHPEGGYFRETFRNNEKLISENSPERYDKDRCFLTSIYFLLKGTQKSKFHRLKSDELWYFHDGTPTTIHFISPEGKYFSHTVGLDIINDQTPQIVIPRHHWFAAEVVDKEGYVLVGCAVAPGFEFEDFELAKHEELSKVFPNHTDLIKRFT